MSERLKMILLTIPITLTLIALSFGAWWLWVERPQLAAQPEAAATRYYAYVFGTARDQNGAPVANVTVTVNGKSSTTNASGEWGVTPAVTVGKTYYFEITVPNGWQLTQWPHSFVASEPPDPIGPFLIVLAPIPAPQPTATATDLPVPAPPTDTPSSTPTDKLPPGTPTLWPTATLTPTIAPDATPTPTPKCYGYHQFSYSERWTAIATGAALIGRDLGEILDWQNDETLVYAAEINLGAPLTRDYEITADDGSRIWCRAYAQGILAIRQVWPCKSERYGVVQWDGVANWVGGELP